jgi:hypothetical protein
MLKIRFKTVTLLFATVMILSIGAVSPVAADSNASVPTPDYIDGASPTIDTDQPIDGTVGTTSHDRFVTDSLVYDAAPEDTLPAGMDQIYAGTDNEYLNLEIEYDGSLSDSGVAVIGLDVDQRLETGTNRAGLSDYDIGVDYALVAGTDGTRESVSYLFAWNERTGEFETIAAEPSSDIVASKAEPTTDTLTVAVERASIEQPDAIDFVLTQSFQDSNQDQFVPPRNEEAITYGLNEDSNEFDFGIELQQDATVTTGDDTTITAYLDSRRESRRSRRA